VNKLSNASFHKTALACTLHGSVAMQLRGDGRFYSRYLHLSFLIVEMKNCYNWSTTKKTDIAKIKLA